MPKHRDPECPPAGGQAVTIGTMKCPGATRIQALALG